MKIELNLNEDIIQILFNRHCSKSECCTCSCQDPYESTTCYHNYKNGLFKTHIQEKFDIMCELIEMTI